MIAHDVADTGYLIGRAAELSKAQWLKEISPGQVVLEWDGEEPSVGAVLGALVWTKEVWLASIEGATTSPGRATDPTTPRRAGRPPRRDRARWTAMVADFAPRAGWATP